MSQARTTPESVIRAMNVHKTNGLIKDWRHNAMAPWKCGGTQRPFYLLVDTIGGPEVELRTLREASVFCDALASAHRAMIRQQAEEA
jgi:hypothetical protein